MRFFIVPALFALFIFSGCLQNETSSTTSSNSDISEEAVSEFALSSTALGFALLTDDEMQSVEGLEKAHPSILEFADHLELNREDAYLYYVARPWSDPLRSDTWVANAISLYASSEDAIAGTELLAGDAEAMSGAASVGDYSLAIYADPEEGDEAFESSLPNVTYRFVVGPCSAKVRVYAQGDLVALPVDSMKSELERMAYELANAQVARLEAILNDEWFAAANLTDGSLVLPNAALLHLPESLPGTNLIGTSLFTQREWRGMEGNFDKDIPGFQTGALRRFKIESRPGEVVEVAVFEFGTATAAQAFQSELVLGEGYRILTLGEDLDAFADAVTLEDLFFELQMVQGRYMVDVTVLNPFADIDAEAAEVDMQIFAREVLSQW